MHAISRHIANLVLGAVATAALLMSTSLPGQSTQRFTGHASDPSGAAITQATVTITNEATSESNVQQTSQSGDYAVSYLKSGHYKISISKAGFKTVTKEQIALAVDQTSNIDFQLPLGEVTEQVTVNASSVQMESSKADRGEIVDSERIEQLPIDGGNSLALFGLSPGTLNRSLSTYPRPFDNVNRNLYANGSTTTAQGNLDGATNDNQSNMNGFVPPTDSVLEFKVVTNPYDAGYGRTGGAVIDVQLKSGTNRLHGDVYEFMRRKWLDANAWQNNYNHIARPNHTRDQYGFELDGPVVIPKLYNGADKTFFLMQYENWDENLPRVTTTLNSIPDPSWLTGNFSNATYFNSVDKRLEPLIIYDPLTPLHTYVDPKDGKTKQAHDPFPGNIIPQSRLDSTGSAIASFYSQIKPNVTPGPGFAPYQNNLYWLPVENDHFHSALVKIDHNLTSRDRVTLRWGWQERFAALNFTGIPSSNPAAWMMAEAQPKAHTAFAEEVHTFSPNTVLDNKIVMMTGVISNYYGETRPGMMNKFNFSQHLLSNISFPNNFPAVNASGFIGFANGSVGDVTNVHTLAYQPSLTHIVGRHAIRMGLDARWQQYVLPLNSVSNSFNFTNGWTGHYYNSTEAPGTSSGSSIASMLLGYMSSGSIPAPSQPFISQHYYALWVQDDFKLNPKLTLNLGLRYDLLGPRTERFNKLDYIFNASAVNPVNSQITNTAPLNGRPVMGGVEFAGVNGNPRGAFKRNLGDIQPRIGVAYSINDKMSIRGGFGMMYFNSEANDSSNGFSSSTGYTNSLNNGVTPYGHLSDPYPSFVSPTGASRGYLTGLGGSYSFTNPHYKVPRILEYSVSFERTLSPRDVIDVSYSGTKTQNLDSSDNINHISAALRATCDVERGGNRQICDNAATGQVPSPFYNVAAFAGTTYGRAPTISTQNLSRPFPAFGDVTENQENELRAWYNSAQLTYSHQLARDLSFHTAYTHSKAMAAGSWADNINRIRSRYISPTDVPNQLSLSGVWYLPIGRGKYLLGNMNRIVDQAIGGWEVAPIYVYTQGFPWTPSGNWEQVSSRLATPQGDLATDSLHAYKRLRGVTPCVGYKDTDTGMIILGPAATAAGCTSAALVQAPNGYAQAHPNVYWGVREPAYHQFDAAVSKNFTLYERMRLQCRVDALNILNHPIWQNSYNSSATNVDFGTQQKGPQGTTSSARQLQLSAKISW